MATMYRTKYEVGSSSDDGSGMKMKAVTVVAPNSTITSIIGSYHDGLIDWKVLGAKVSSDVINIPLGEGETPPG